MRVVALLSTPTHLVVKESEVTKLCSFQGVLKVQILNLLAKQTFRASEQVQALIEGIDRNKIPAVRLIISLMIYNEINFLQFLRLYDSFPLL